ncbi:MAG: phosphoadenosine phosphosulfate reductase family protein [Proteobacteria bacterium]|nr:phosphoadenosine phosphosulfate reductase family protein [Pseudomonadota bacterium]
MLSFSGGKDSLVCLHLCRDYRDKIDVCWVNTGAMFPHMAAFVRKAVEGFNFVELKSDQAAWIKQQGLPSDMVPVANSLWRDPGVSDPPQTMIQPWTMCCAKLRFQPILDYLARSNATLFIHGQRRSDGGGLVFDSGPDAPVEICKLIWEWSERDVMDYIGKHGIALPEQYADGVMGSLECWSCTARAGDSDAKMAARFAYMAKRYPDLFKELKLQMGRVFLATEAAFKSVKADATYAWLEAAEEAEEAEAVRPRGAGPKCAPERGSPGHDLVDCRARP